MRNTFHQRLLGAFAGVALLAPVVAGCASSSSDDSCPTTAEPGLAVAVGARAGSPAPQLPSSFAKDVAAVADADKGYTVVRVDGHPTIACSAVFNGQGLNPGALAKAKSDFESQAVNDVYATRATSAEADTLGALAEAGEAAGPGGTVLLIDSGLQTVAPLDFRANGLLDTDPQAIVDQLRSKKLLPDLTGRTVKLTGIGYTAEPQAPLGDADRKRLQNIWAAIVTAAVGGTRPAMNDSPTTGDALDHVPAVSTVPVAPPDNIVPGCNQQSVLSDGGTVGFVPNRATFIDESAARTTLTRFADFLGANSSATIELTGTVAHYGRNEKDAGLALDRARAVADTLVGLGVDPGRVTAHGGGWGPYDGSGNTVDQRNRRVVLLVRC